MSACNHVCTDSMWREGGRGIGGREEGRQWRGKDGDGGRWEGGKG